MPVPRNLLPFNTRPCIPQLVCRFIQFPQSRRHGFVVIQQKPQPPTFSPDVRERDPRSHEPSECFIHAVALICF